jgi:myo-inositol-1(or 4)-monophosphatase
LAAVIERVIDAARAAGEAIQAVQRATSKGVTTKSDSSPVTDADRAADALLRERLSAIEDVAWLSEESADDKSRLGKSRLWIVDPLDGTKEFVEGVPQYAVAIALVEGTSPVLAVIHNPASGHTFSAERSKGAFLDGKPIRARSGTVLLASRSEMKRGEFEPFTDWTLNPVGSIALKLGMIGAGEAAATVSRGPKWEWDVCAGALIVEEAGGVVTDMFGQPLRFNNSFPKVKGVVAGVRDAHARLLSRLAEIGASDRMNEFGA